MQVFFNILPVAYRGSLPCDRKNSNMRAVIFWEFIHYKRGSGKKYN